MICVHTISKTTRRRRRNDFIRNALWIQVHHETRGPASANLFIFRASDLNGKRDEGRNTCDAITRLAIPAVSPVGERVILTLPIINERHVYEVQVFFFHYFATCASSYLKFHAPARLWRVRFAHKPACLGAFLLRNVTNANKRLHATLPPDGM